LAKQQKGRPRSENPMIHTAVVLPQDLLNRLKEDAAASGHGLSTEIRQRLQVGYPARGLVEPADPETNELLNKMDELSANLARSYGKKWHQHPYVLKAFKAGVDKLVAQYHPEGDEKVPPNIKGPPLDHDPPDIVGRIFAGLTGPKLSLPAHDQKMPSGKK
jgi:hypothetical protein